MSIDKGGNSPEKIDPFEMLRGMMKQRKLDVDTFNDWMAGMHPSADLRNLKPKKRYAERYEFGNESEYAKILLELSDPEAVAAYDQVVDEFNADLERIKTTQDREAVKKFYQRACDLIYSNR